MAFRFKVYDIDYAVYVTSETMKCFGCGTEGQLVCSYPDRVGECRSAESLAEPPHAKADCGPTSLRETHIDTPNTKREEEDK